MKRITIGGMEYTFEFSIEASMYDDLTVEVMNQMIGYSKAKAEAEAANSLDDRKSVIQEVVAQFANVPKTTLTLFYAGLLEHHSDTIHSRSDAKAILKTYLVENDEKDMNDVLNEMIEIIGEDHFFEKYAPMNKMIATETKQTKKPQDHKKAGAK